MMPILRMDTVSNEMVEVVVEIENFVVAFVIETDLMWLALVDRDQELSACAVVANFDEVAVGP